MSTILLVCIYTQVGHKLRFSLVLINDSCVVQVRNSTLLLTLRALLSLINPHPEKNRNLCPTWVYHLFHLYTSISLFCQSL